MNPKLWTVRLSAAAQEDYKQILRWSRDSFGQLQARVYKVTLDLALKDLCEGPEIVGVKLRSDIYPDSYTLHVERKGRKGRHFIHFQVGAAADGRFLNVLRILHDQMDLARHLAADDVH